MKHIKAISCLLLSSLVLTAFCGCDGSREESGVSDAMSGTYSVVSEAVSDVSAEEISMESFGEESGVMSGAEESSEEEFFEYVENISDYTVMTDSSGNCYVEKYNGSDKYITVPSEYDGKPIISVSPFAFEGCDIEGIVFSEGIKEIGIRREPSLDMGGTGVCGSLTVTKVKLPSSLEALGYMMGSQIREITLPAKLRGINQGTFSGCKQLERVEFLGENTGIGEQAFWDCTALSELILPKGLSWLPRGAISGCTSLKSLTLPDAYKGEPMFLPKDITYIVRRGSVAEKTLSDYNAGDLVTTPIKYTVTEPAGEESGVMSGAEESSEEEPSGEESSEEEFSEEEYSGVELSEYVENAEDYTYIHYGEEGNGVYVLAKYNGTDEYIRIPSEYKGEPVTFIGDSPSGDLPFGDNIKGVIIPASCKGTMWGAFSACTSLESAVCAGDDPIEFGLFCFAGCNALKRLVLPKNQEYLPRSFLPGPGTQLKTLRLPDGLKSDPNITLSEAGKAGTVFIVRRGSVAEKTLADYNAGDWGTTPIKYTVTD